MPHSKISVRFWPYDNDDFIAKIRFRCGASIKKHFFEIRDKWASMKMSHRFVDRDDLIWNLGRHKVKARQMIGFVRRLRHGGFLILILLFFCKHLCDCNLIMKWFWLLNLTGDTTYAINSLSLSDNKEFKPFQPNAPHSAWREHLFY